MTVLPQQVTFLSAWWILKDQCPSGEFDTEFFILTGKTECMEVCDVMWFDLIVFALYNLRAYVKSSNKVSLLSLLSHYTGLQRHLSLNWFGLSFTALHLAPLRSQSPWNYNHFSASLSTPSPPLQWQCSDFFDKSIWTLFHSCLGNIDAEWKSPSKQ